MKKIILVAGARPNLMKIAPILREVEKYDDLRAVLVHTGQHYDENMSAAFFSSLGIKQPDYDLDTGSGTHAIQTAAIMTRFEEVCEKESPDAVIVVGDVNSTIAAGLVAKKLQILLAHVEAGLRSRDRSMPEEINRIATDAISDLLFTTEEQGTQNHLAEGHSPGQVHFVGHVMIDNLLYQLEKLDNGVPSVTIRSIKSMLPSRYICLTMHRPSNVDNKATFTRLMSAISVLSKEAPVVFPCHPRTRERIYSFNMNEQFQPLPTRPKNKIKTGFFYH